MRVFLESLPPTQQGQPLPAFDVEHCAYGLVRDIGEGRRGPDGGGGRFVDQAGGDAGGEVRVGHEVAGEVVFALEGLCDVPGGAVVHLAEGDFEGGWGAVAEGLQGLGGPSADGGGGAGAGVGLEGGDDEVDGGGAEAAVDG